MSDSFYCSSTSRTRTTYNATITLVGGSGNTVPVYSTNQAFFQIIGNMCFTELGFTGDGGAEGAGTGQINISLPVTAHANMLNGRQPLGRFNNGATGQPIYVQVAGSATTATFSKQSAATTIANLTGADQNNTTRGIRGIFNYRTNL